MKKADFRLLFVAKPRLFGYYLDVKFEKKLSFAIRIYDLYLETINTLLIIFSA